MKPLIVPTSFGPVTLTPTDDRQVIGTFKPKIWPKVDLFFSHAEVQNMHSALGQLLHDFENERLGKLLRGFDK